MRSLLELCNRLAAHPEKLTCFHVEVRHRLAERRPPAGGSKALDVRNDLAALADCEPCGPTAVGVVSAPPDFVDICGSASDKRAWHVLPSGQFGKDAKSTLTEAAGSPAVSRRIDVSLFAI